MWLFRAVYLAQFRRNDFIDVFRRLLDVRVKAIGVPPNRITAILKRQRGITGDTAVRLGAFFNTTAEFWMNLQKTYELRLAEKSLPGRVTRRIEENRQALREAV